MRKKLFAFALLAIAAISVVGQALRRTEKIHQNQVPIAIRQAFENDFGKISEDGYWIANFIVQKDNSRSIAKPLSYTFHKKGKSAKIEIRYTAAGDLEYTKGIERSNSSGS